MAKKLLVFLVLVILIPGCGNTGIITSGVEAENVAISSNHEMINGTSSSSEIAYMPEVKRLTVQKNIAIGEEPSTFCFECVVGDKDINVEVSTKDHSQKETYQFNFKINTSRTSFNMDEIIQDENFADFNFDGYLDYHCFVDVSINGRQPYFRGWLWDADIEAYKETNINEIPSMRVQERDQTIRGGYGGAGGMMDQIYQYVDGEFVLTNELAIVFFPPHDSDTGTLMYNYCEEEDGYLQSYVEAELIDGEMVQYPVICDTEEGRARFHDRIYGENSIWYPSR